MATMAMHGRLQHPSSAFLCLLCLLYLVLSISQFHQSQAFPFHSQTRREVLQTTIGSIASTSTSTTTTSIEEESSAQMNMNAEMSKSIKWGIVGLGDVCQQKSGPAFYKCHGSELVAVMRRTPGKASEFASTVPAGEYECVGYDHIEDFLKHDGLDAVYVSTRPGTHLEICRKVAEANLNCYVEKPVGRCAREAEEIDRMFTEKGLKLYTAFISRAYDRTHTVRSLLKDGALGHEIAEVTYTLIGSGGARDMDGELPWRLDAQQSGGGLIMDVGCHVLDRIDYICGPLLNVKGSAKQKNAGGKSQVEDYVHLTADIGDAPWAVLPHQDGATVQCTWDFAPSRDQQPFDELRITGSNGCSLRMAGMSADGVVGLYDEKGLPQQKYTFDMPQHTAQALIQAVTDDMRGIRKNGGEQSNYVLAYGENGIRTQRVIDVALNSYYGGRESGYWLRSETWPGRASIKSST